MTSATPSSDQPGLVITFYSFKGGTGRSMSLANVAWILASNGYRVLTVDWDLESPGLHRYFHPFLVDKTLKSSPGVLEMVREFATATLEPGDHEDDDWVHGRARILNYAASLDWPFPLKGSIDFVPAGRQTPSYSRAVSTFEWVNFYDRLGGGAFLDALREDMRREYDYILIDSRTGLSDTAGICTVQLPDVVVDCFTSSSQSIDGAAAVAQSIRAQQGAREIRIVPVLMRTDASEKGKLDSGREAARARFAPLLTPPDPALPLSSRVAAEVPYVPYYAYEEILAPFGDAPGLPTSLLAAFERLTAVLTDGGVTALAPMDERVRRQRLAEFERSRQTPLSDLVISYSAHDRFWAEWLRSELSSVGYRVILSCVDLPGRETTLSSTANPLVTVALLSQDYVAAHGAAALWQSLGARERGGGQEPVVLLLDGVRPPAPFDRPAAVDLSGVSERDIRNRVMIALGQGSADGDPLGRDPGLPGASRFPGAIPQTFTVQQRNDLFTGRADILEELRDRLSASSPEIQPQVLYGLGGVGKTQIVVEYAHRFAADYDLVWWVSAEQPALMRASLARLAPVLGLSQGSDQAADMDAVLHALRTADSLRRWLLIFDNMDDPGELASLLPAHGHGHVLITSRTPGWSPRGSIEVTVFSRDQSIALLRRRARDLARPDADAVAERLGDLPLAIEQAGAWLAATGAPVATYLDLLDTRMPDVLTRGQPQDYPHTAAATWLVSLDRLRDQRPAAARLMELCACFASEPIPTRWLLKEPVTSILAQYDAELRDPMLLAQLFQEVGRYSLARVDAAQGAIEVHRLVQVVVREQMDPEQRAMTRHQVLDILVAANPNDTDNPGTWPHYAELWPHVSAWALESESPEVRLLVADLVRYLWRSGDRRSSRELAERAIGRWIPQFGEDDRITLLMRDRLSNVFLSLGEFRTALEISEDVVERLTRTRGVHHPNRLIAVMSLTGSLQGVGHYARARALSEEILQPTQLAFGENDGRTLNALNNVANSARLAGDFAKAAEIDEEVYQRRRATMSPVHPHTLVSAANLGRDLRECGKFTRSRSQLQAVVDTLVETLGKDHLDTIRARNNLAVTLRKLGEFNAAHGTSTAALDRALRVLGPAHPDSQAIGLNLACDESALGRHENAVVRAKGVLELYQQNLGEEHCFSLIATNNLSIFTRLAGRPAEATHLSRRAWQGLAQVFGPQHPSTLCAQLNQGNDLFATGHADAARELDEDTYRQLSDRVGDQHPDALAAGSNLAISRRMTGDSRAADSLGAQILRQMIDVLGEGHPNCRSLREGVRLNCDIEQPLI